jgi:hypothetical protein
MSNLKFLRPEIGSPVTIDIKTSTPVGAVDCVSIAKGVLLTSSRIILRNQTATFTFTPSWLHAPRTDLVFYFISSSGEIVSSRVPLEFKNELPNIVIARLFCFDLIKKKLFLG